MWEGFKAAMRIVFFTVLIVIFGWTVLSTDPIWAFFIVYIAFSYAVEEIDTVFKRKK